VKRVKHSASHQGVRVALAAIVILLVWSALGVALRADGVVHFYYFFDRECPVCAQTHLEVIGPLLAKYGQRVAIDERDMSDPPTFEYVLRLEQQYGVLQAGIPEVFIGGDALIGPDAIRDKLQERIDHYLALGGIGLPEIPGLAAPAKAPTSTSTQLEGQVTPTAQPLGEKAIYLAWFYDPGCDLCERKEHDLTYVLDKYPQVKASRFNGDEDTALFQYLCTKFGVPEDRHLVAPSVFVGDNYLVAQEISGGTMEALILPYLYSGSAEPWAGFSESAGSAESTLVGRFRSLGLLTVAGAGLIDGVNPCAFATMIFLVSYLSVRKRKGRELLITGAAFTLGVFLAYLGLGLGILKFLTAIPVLDVLGRWIYGFTMLLCLLLAWGSFADYLKARAGRLEDMSLKLPPYLRGLERRLIREGTRSRNFVLASFGLGFVVSVVELACTGQVYLPTIIFVLGLPDWRARATLALVVYNLMFIVPLVVVFVLVYYGTTSQHLTAWMQRRAASVKLGMAVLFLLLAVWLGYSIVSVV